LVIILHERGGSKIRVLLIVLIGNLSVCIIKILIGLASGFMFIVADGIHSLSDTLTNVIGILSLKLAMKKPDEKHPYGYEKYETIGALIVGCFCLFLSFEVLKEGIVYLINPIAEFGNVIIAYVAMGISTLMSLLIYVYENRAGRRLGSDLLVADSEETKSDIFLTLTVIAGIYLTDAGFIYVNGILTLIISLLIFRTAINIIKSSSKILTDVNVIPREKIYEVVMSHPEVRFCHAIRSRGRPDAIYIDLHVGVDPNMTVERAHDVVSHEIKLMLRKTFPGLKCVNIHIEPDNEQARKRMRSVFKEVDY